MEFIARIDEESFYILSERERGRRESKRERGKERKKEKERERERLITFT